ncbi:MAG: 16S rRNA (adenine(1518)-N(6)/adenine(1519)-N(6))-dimethyltransferase, partial [Deltaproteobacteria bacterium]|nr:16S rRNA (adenine(1518)-N(6)/adenine(1519)-N(6))-dimethyltransferase [Candidatus Tharpella aukensis]
DEIITENRKLSAPVAVVANIPYQITTPILFRLIKYRHLFSRAILMMQEEVAARLVAAPGSRDYGRLTVGVGLYCDINSGFKVSPNAFSPKPKVWSRVVRFEFRDQPRYPVADPALFERLVFTLFSQRRKQIINPLKGMMTHLTREELSERLLAAGFSPSDRPATLPPAELVRLSSCLAAW